MRRGVSLFFSHRDTVRSPGRLRRAPAALSLAAWLILASLPALAGTALAASGSARGSETAPVTVLAARFGPSVQPSPRTLFAPPRPSRSVETNSPAEADRPAAPGQTVKQAAAVNPAAPPRSILVVGDSFAVGLGMTLATLLPHDTGVRLVQKGKTSSGLESPRFYDWPRVLEASLKETRADTVVVMIGGNDAHNGPGTPEWAEAYKAKAAAFRDLALRHGARVVWVGLPPMRDAAYNRRVELANRAMRAICESTGGCRFVASWDLFTDDKGAFAAQKTIAGKTVTLRAKDGVHLTPTGARLLTGRIIEAAVTRQTPDRG